MSDEELIKLARELQFAYYYETGETVGLDKLRAFADRVAAHEREACAKVCEETTAAWTQHLYNSGCVDCSAAIRARGQA
jgi:hypothetical protein